MATTAEREPANPAELQILTADGVLLHNQQPSVSTEHLRPIYEVMVKVRRLEARLDGLHRRGEVGFFAASAGEEAATVAAAAALRPEDWLFTGRRDLGAALWRGVSVQRVLDGVFGNASDGAKGRSMPGLVSSRSANVVGGSGLPGNHLAHAAGCAWAARIRGDRAVALALFHEAAAEAADFHTALNFAGVLKTPVIFAGRSRGPKGDLAARAQAYGLEGVLCDGLDPLAVLTATATARERALSGGGATLIEFNLAGGSDPVERARLFLERQGALQADTQRALEAQIDAEIDAAVDHAAKAPAPPVASLIDDTFARTPWHLAEQRAALAGGSIGDR